MEDVLASNGKQLGKGNHDAWGPCATVSGLAEDRVSQAPAAISYSTSMVSYTCIVNTYSSTRTCTSCHLTLGCGHATPRGPYFAVASTEQGGDSKERSPSATTCAALVTAGGTGRAMARRGTTCCCSKQQRQNNLNSQTKPTPTRAQCAHHVSLVTLLLGPLAPPPNLAAMMAEHFDDRNCNDLRNERYMRRCRDVECDVDRSVSTSLSFEDCFELCAGSPDGSPVDSPLRSAVPSSCDSSRSTSPSAVDDDDDSVCALSPAREKRSSRTNRARRRSAGAGPNPNHCSRASSAATQKNSPVSVLDVAAADTLGSMSLDELLGCQSGGGAPSQSLDFSLFDSLGSRQASDCGLAAAIAAVMAEACACPAAAVRELLAQLLLARARGYASCELNAVTYNRLVTRLVALRELAAAAQVLDVMAADSVSFTTVDDDWVVGGRLDAAVSALRSLICEGFPPRPETQHGVVLAWLWMGMEGLKAAAAINTVMCERGCSLTAKTAEGLVHALLGRPVRRCHNSSFPHLAPAEVAQVQAKARVLEDMLVRMLESPCVHFEEGALAALLRALEACVGGGADLTTMGAARRLCEVLRLLCARLPGRQPCIRSLSTFLQILLRERRFEAAAELLRATPGAEVDEMFLTSALHAVAAASVAPEDEEGDRASPTGAALAGLLGAVDALCALAAGAAPAVRLSYSVLNQTLNTLRAVGSESGSHSATASSGTGSTDDQPLREAAAAVGAALFEGLHRLHAKAANRRTFDRLFELLLAAGADKRLMSDDLLAALRRVHVIAEEGGFVLAPETAERLAALGVGMSAVRHARAVAASQPINIDSGMSRSSSSDKQLFAMTADKSGGGAARSAPRSRIVFAQ